MQFSQRQSQPGSVVTQQSTGGAGVQGINTSVQVTGDFSGSVPSPDVPSGPITLTLADAVRRGLQNNLGAITAANSARSFHAAEVQARSALLPNIRMDASETVTQVNLAASGLTFKVPSNLNFSIPTIVGPFSFWQAQGTFSQSLFDLVQIRNFSAARQEAKAAVLTSRDTRDLVVLAVAGAYLQILATLDRVDSQQAQVTNAEAVWKQAQVRLEAGTNAKIDVMRTLVELQTQQQRLNLLSGDLQKQKINLARMVGLPLDRELKLSEQMIAPNATPPAAADALATALNKRNDVVAMRAQVRAAELSLAAAKSERLPSVSVSGDYGVLGRNPSSSHGVFAVTGSISMPVWQGGQISGDIEQAEATLHQRQSEFADLRGRVEQEVRAAIIDVETAIVQVKVADTNRGYAAETLREARDRFNLGVTTSVEVVQAQEQVAGAESDYISSLFSYEVGRIGLARALGEAETALPDLLRGSAK